MDIRDCKVNFKCSERWADLAQTEDANVRYCDLCRQSVHFCSDAQSLQTATELDQCVAIPLTPTFDDEEPAVMMGDIEWNGPSLQAQDLEALIRDLEQPPAPHDPLDPFSSPFEKKPEDKD